MTKNYATACDVEREREELIYTIIYNWPQWSDLVSLLIVVFIDLVYFREKSASGTCLLYMKSNKVYPQKQQNFDTQSPNSTFTETKLQKIALSFLCEVS